MNRILTLAGKDLLLLWRDKFGLFWVLLFPLMFGLFFGAITGGGGGERGGMSVALIDDDQSDASRAVVKKLEENKGLRRATPQTLGVESLNQETAARQVRLGKLTAFVLLKKGFGASLLDFGGGPARAPQAAMIEVGIDPSRQAEAGMLQGVIMESYFSVLVSQFTNPAVMKEQVKKWTAEIDRAEGLSFLQRTLFRQFFSSLDGLMGQIGGQDLKQAGGNPLQGPKIELVNVARDDKANPLANLKSSYEITFPSAIQWSLLSCMLTFAVSIVVERKQGTLLRLSVAPISRLEILAGKGLACFASCAGAAFALLLLGHYLFNVRFSNLAYLVLAVAAAAVCFTGLMLLVSVLGKTEQAVGGAASGLMVAMAMFGGGMIPLAFMPGWMQTLSGISPCKWSILAMEGAIWRNFTFAEMLLPCGILLAIGALAFGLGLYWLSRRVF